MKRMTTTTTTGKHWKCLIFCTNRSFPISTLTSALFCFAFQFPTYFRSRFKPDPSQKKRMRGNKSVLLFFHYIHWVNMSRNIFFANTPEALTRKIKMFSMFFFFLFASFKKNSIVSSMKKRGKKCRSDKATYSKASEYVTSFNMVVKALERLQTAFAYFILFPIFQLF